MKDKQEYNNGRQLRIEDYLQENKLETEGNVEVPSVFDVFLLKEIDTKTVTNELLDKILSKDNMKLAFKRVKEWKKIKTKHDNYWRISKSPILSKSLNNKILEGYGYTSLSRVYC